jgi:hypothetical protein
MAEPVSDPKLLLREDLSKEYYPLLDVISNYDGWLLIVKGWSVTLSLAGLGLGFQQRHFALFALAAGTAAAFWYLDALMKGYQYRYYVRMREIEYTAYLINAVVLGGEYWHKRLSAPRIDMTWDFKGYPVLKGTDMPRQARQWWWRDALGLDPKPERYDWRADEPWRRKPQEINKALWRRFSWPNVMLPHIVAVVAGSGLFIAAVAGGFSFGA